MNTYFEQFQIEEYKNIAYSHFEANKQIGFFFRYFLVIASTPALIFAWFGKDNPKFIDYLINGNIISINLFVGFFLIFISIIGILSSFYLVSLRLDSILYARTINGTRKYFYKFFSFENEEIFRVLPKQTNLPKYFDNHTFGVLFYAVAIINSVYFAIGTRIIASVGKIFFENYLHLSHCIVINNYNIWWTVIVLISLFILHIIYYYFISQYRMINYMKSRIIGIDIDGVLNKHRDTFCKIHSENLKKHYNDNIPPEKSLLPNEIMEIPVNQIKTKNITRDDEFDVFNNPRYWEEQEIIDKNVPKIIRELHNVFGFKIFIHSYRPWTQYSYGKEKYLWEKTLSKITKKWLKKNEIIYDKLYMEKNNIDIANRSISLWGALFGISISNFKNRFFYTLRKPYKYFIEDDIDNAIKLANNCEYVFLYDQPYNRKNDKNLPNNIIVVKDWEEISIKIKELG